MRGKQAAPRRAALLSYYRRNNVSSSRLRDPISAYEYVIIYNISHARRQIIFLLATHRAIITITIILRNTRVLFYFVCDNLIIMFGSGQTVGAADHQTVLFYRLVQYCGGREGYLIRGRGEGWARHKYLSTLNDWWRHVRISSAPHADDDAAGTISVFIVPRRFDVVVGDGQDGVNDWYYNVQYHSPRRIITIIKCVCIHRYHYYYYTTAMSGTNTFFDFFIENKLSRVFTAYYSNTSPVSRFSSYIIILCLFTSVHRRYFSQK